MSKTETKNTAVACPANPAIELVEVEKIVVGEGARPFSGKVIDGIAESMKSIGLLTPITIRFGRLENQHGDPYPILVSGNRRLEAAKLLGWNEIACLVASEGAIEAELRAIAENLHRKVLTKKQRDEHIRRYAELLRQSDLQSGQSVPIESKRDDGKGHKRLGLAGRIAAETGLSKKTIDRALAPSTKDNSDGDDGKSRSPDEVALNRLQASWERAKPATRKQFIDWATQQLEPEGGDIDRTQYALTNNAQCVPQVAGA